MRGIDFSGGSLYIPSAPLFRFEVRFGAQNLI